MKEKFNEKVIPVILKFINTKGIQSIKNGMVTSMSPLIIGSIFLILSNFPIKAVVDVLESTGIKAVLDQACGATFSISAMIAVIGISYSYALIMIRTNILRLNRYTIEKVTKIINALYKNTNGVPVI